MLVLSSNVALALALMLSTRPCTPLAARPTDFATSQGEGATTHHHQRATVVLLPSGRPQRSKAATSPSTIAAPYSRAAMATAEADAVAAATTFAADAGLAPPEDSPMPSTTPNKRDGPVHDVSTVDVARAVPTVSTTKLNILSYGMAGWHCAGITAVLAALASSAMFFHVKRELGRRSGSQFTHESEPLSSSETSSICSGKVLVFPAEVEKIECDQIQLDAHEAAEEVQEHSQQAKFDSFDGGCLSHELWPVPESFKCPITKEIMFDPVSTVDGLTYERDSILTWFRLGHRTSPLTNMALPSLQIQENIALKCAISELRRLRPEVQRRELQRRDFEVAVMDREDELEDSADKCSHALEQKESETESSVSGSADRREFAVETTCST